MVNFISANNGIFLNSFLKYDITKPLRIAHFLAQIAHESNNFTRIEESLNYTPDGLMKTNPFNRKLTREQANKYGRTSQHPANQVMIANIAYANSNGNGSVASGDGWKYRGRGFIQLTKKGNYQAYKDYSGHDVINNPDLLFRNDIALDCAGWYFSVFKKLNSLADLNSTKAITKAINGGTNGMPDRLKKLKYFKSQKITLEELKKKVNPRLQKVKPTAWSWFNIGTNNIFYKK
jgi:putative chitinase